MASGSKKSEARVKALLSSRIAYIAVLWAMMSGVDVVWHMGKAQYDYGGAFFWIMYTALLFLVVIPGIIAESAMGAYARKSAPAALKSILGDKYEYVGWLITITCWAFTAYFVVWTSHALAYMVFSLKFLIEGAPPSFPDFWAEYACSWWPFIFSMVSWILMWFVMIRGVASLEKIALYSRPILFILLLLVAIMGLQSLPDFTQGVFFVVHPNPEILFDVAAWAAMITMIVWRLGPGFGVYATFASYLPKGGEITDSNILPAFLDMALCYAASFVVFGLMIGAHQLPMEYEDLAFTAVPAGFYLIKGGALAAFLFYLLMYLLGFTCAATFIEMIGSTLMDKFGVSRKMFTTVVIFWCIVASIFYTIPIPDEWGGSLGFRVLYVSDYYDGVVTLISALIETIVLAYIWGAEKIRRFANETGDIKLPSWYFNTCLKVVAPILMFFGFAYEIIWPLLENPPEEAIACLGLAGGLVYLASYFILPYIMWKVSEDKFDRAVLYTTILIIVTNLLLTLLGYYSIKIGILSG